MTDTNGTGPHLTLPRVEVVLSDGRTEVVQLRNVDLLSWDRTAARHKWPDFQSVRTWHATYCAWAALRREGRIPKDTTWEQFSEGDDPLCLQVTAVTGDDGEPEEEPVADPTRSAPAPA